MLQKSWLSILTVTLLAAVACSNKNKLPLSKTAGAPGGGVQTESMKKVAKLVADSKGCLPLGDILKQWQSQDKDTFQAYVNNRELITGNDLLNLDSNAALNDLKARFEVLIKAQADIPLIETVYGAQLTASTLVGDLLSVPADPNDAKVPLATDCKQIVFKSGRSGNVPNPFIVNLGASKGKADPATPGSLTLVSANEVRIYKMVGPNLEISVNTAVLPTPALPCDGSKPTSLIMHTKYVIVPGDPSTVGLRPRFAALLGSTMAQVPPTLKAKLDIVFPASAAAPAAAKPDPKKRSTAVTGAGLQVALSTLYTFNAEIQKAQFQAVSCTKP